MLLWEPSCSLALLSPAGLLPSDSEASLLLVLQPCSPALPRLRNLLSICSHCCCSEPFTQQELILLCTLAGGPQKTLPAPLFLILKLMLTQSYKQNTCSRSPSPGLCESMVCGFLSAKPALACLCTHTGNREADIPWLGSSQEVLSGNTSTGKDRNCSAGINLGVNLCETLLG